MKRKVIDQLIRWKTQNNGKPILLTGAKGVGKTYLAYDFAKAFFERICYLNFERDPKSVGLIHEGKTDKTADKLMKYFKLDPEQPAEARLLILDEIGCNPEVLTLLETIDLSQVFSFVIYISSNPVPSDFIREVTKVPVYPLEFDEFLLATGNEWYIESIITHYNNDRKIPDIVHKELLALLQLYLQIGGMPGLVNEYLNMATTVNISEQHSFLTGSYHDYIIRDNTDSEALKMNQVFDSLVHQLMKDNKKFQYKLIRKGTTHSMYKDAIQKLCDYNYIIKCNRISNEQLLEPVQTFLSQEWQSIEENTNFKLYMPDTGLLYSKLTQEQGITLEPEHRKALLENYVAESLRSKNYPFAFWESESMAKVDFIFLKDEVMLPVEIFENDNTRSKSISVLKQKCNFPYAVKISSKNFEFSNGVKYVPYYAVFCL